MKQDLKFWFFLNESILSYSSGHPFTPHLTLKLGLEACCKAMCLTSVFNVSGVKTKQILHMKIFAMHIINLYGLGKPKGQYVGVLSESLREICSFRNLGTQWTVVFKAMLSFISKAFWRIFRVVYKETRFIKLLCISNQSIHFTEVR